MMKCLALGDVMLSTAHFDAILAGDPLFTQYNSMGWNENLDRAEAREMVRRVETLGYNSYEIPEQYMRAVEDVEVLFIHLFPVSRRFLERAAKLKYIVTARGGVENIDIKAAKEQGVCVIHCPAHNAVAVAEYTLGLILAETRNIGRADIAMHNGEWRERYPNSQAIPELSDAVVGIVGFGTIGRIVAGYLSVFGSRIVVSDPFVDPRDIERHGYESATLDQLLRQSDVVTLHGRLSAGDPPIIGKRELEMMKETAYLVNTARAVLIDMDALEWALREKKIMGAAIDVFYTEPVPKDHPLLKLDNVTVTNHRGGDTLNCYAKAPELLMRQFRELLETGATHYMIK